MNQSHTAALSSAPELRLEVVSLDPRIPPNAIPDREIELISLLEDLKMLTNKLADLKSSHVFFGTGEDMIFRPIENVTKMVTFMEAGLVWIRWTLLGYETAASAPNSVPETVEARLDKLRVVMDEFFRQMYANDKVVQREFRRIVEEEDAEYRHLDKLLAGSMKLDEVSFRSFYFRLPLGSIAFPSPHSQKVTLSLFLLPSNRVMRPEGGVTRHPLALGTPTWSQDKALLKVLFSRLSGLTSLIPPLPSRPFFFLINVSAL